MRHIVIDIADPNETRQSALAAAIGAARAGVSVILLERNGCFGGNITQVGVEGFAWYRHDATVDSEGAGIEFEERAKSMASGIIPSDLTTIGGTWGAISDQGDLTYLNLIHLEGIDGTDVQSLAKGEIEGRRQAMYAAEAIRRFTPGAENAKLRNFGMTIGIRDTRKIDAHYNLTASDVREQGRFDDSVGIFPEFIDGYGILILPTTGRYFQVPYRSMLSKKIKNLLVTGRSIGGDRDSHAAVRNMMCCTVAGQGAGVAAAVSVTTDRSVDAVDIALVQTELKRQEVRVF